MFKLFVDPGHGGGDPGAVYGGYEEEDFTLDIGLRIRRIIQEEYTGVEVKMSRTKDVYPTLKERVNAANNRGADFFFVDPYQRRRGRWLRVLPIHECLRQNGNDPKGAP